MARNFSTPHPTHRYLWLLAIAWLASGCSPDQPARTDKSKAESAGKKELPILVQLPDFKLRDQTGNSFGTDQLKDKPWVGNFIFTRCPTTCPIQTRNLAKLQKQLKKMSGAEDVQLVSITVDPQFDTEAVLADYAQKMKADPQGLHFLTGTRDDIWQLCKKGFKLAVDDAPPESPSPIMHSSKMMLVDREGRIRGFYEGTTREGIGNLRSAIEKLVEPNDKS